MNQIPAASLPSLLCRKAMLATPTAYGGEEYWKNSAAVTFREAVRGNEPQQGTSVRVLWSNNGFRVLFEVTDDDVWATFTERDSPLYTEEVVELFIDPVGDGASYYEIEVNPLNAVLDVVLRRNRSGYLKDFGWRCEDLETVVRDTATGWNCEMHVPFASITSTVPVAGAAWRVNFLRIDRPKHRERELSAWSPPMVGTFHVPARFGTLLFAD